jgi:hypothetical protein
MSDTPPPFHHGETKPNYFKDDSRKNSDIAASHAFLAWFGKFHQWGVTNRKNEIHVSKMVSARFGIRIEKLGIVALGVLTSDLAAFTSIVWVKALLYRKPGGTAFLVFTTGEKKSEDRLRLFLPVSENIATNLEKHKPDPSDPDKVGVDVLIVREIKPTTRKTGKIPYKEGTPPLDVPFEFRDDTTKAA